MKNITEEQKKMIVTQLGNGIDLDTAAAVAGVSTYVLYGYLERGKIEQERIIEGGKPYKREAPYLSLWEEITQARGKGVAQAQQAIISSFKDDWKAAAWYLERTHPTVFSTPATKAIVESKVKGELE